MAFCDLHMHSTASDGTDPPQVLPRLAAAAGLEAFALTDHDTTAGLVACAAAAKDVGIDFVPGIELSVDPGEAFTIDDGQGTRRTGTVHILGYFVQHDAPALLAIHGTLMNARAERNPQIIARLNRLGIDLDYDAVLELAAAQGSTVIGRPHIAALLVERGHARDVADAFKRYLGEGRAAYVRKDHLSAADAIAAIHAAGGLASLAHPIQMRYRDAEQLETIVRSLKDAGLDAIECWHCDHTADRRNHYRALADRFDLMPTGGSDYHGSRKAISLGAQGVPLEVYHALRDAVNTR